MDFDSHILFQKVGRGHTYKGTTHTIIMKFLEKNILASFGCPRKIIVDNSQGFKYVNLFKFCQGYNIYLGHSTSYYP
jgi:hypothetical protein